MRSALALSISALFVAASAAVSAADASEKLVRELLEQIRAEEAAVENAGEEGEPDTSKLEKIRAELGEMDRAAVPALVAIVGEKGSAIRGLALEFLTLTEDHRGVPTIKACLKDSSPEIRCLAAETLGEFGDRSAVPFLVEFLRNETDDSAKTGGCDALGSLEAKEGVETLLSIVQTKGRDDDVARFSAIYALSDIKDGRAIPALVKICLDPKDPERATALEALGEIGGEGVAEQILPLLDEEDPEFRLAVVGALLHLRDKKALPRLEMLKESLEKSALLPPVPVYAALAGISGEKRYFDKLAEGLSSDSPQVRRQALEHLGEVGGSMAFDCLLTAWGTEKDQELKDSILAFIADLGDPRAYDLLAGQANHKDPAMRGAILAGLGKTRDKRAFAAISAAVNDEEAFVRTGAVEGLKELGDPRAAPLLADCMANGKRFTRALAYRALLSITGKNLPYDPAVWTKEYPK